MPSKFDTLAAAAAWFDAWLVEAALPLWAGAGRDVGRGSFEEALTVEGLPVAKPRRARVQARQIWSFASAAADGLGEAYGQASRAAYAFYRAHYRRPDGLYARSADVDGRILDATPAIYEQAFSLLAMASQEALAPGGVRRDACDLLAAMEPLRHAAGGYREADDQPYQANAHMHLLEAALAWEEAAGEGPWRRLADEAAGLALTRFIDPKSGVLREFFDADWNVLADDAGGLIEPGHQFEWAWLLDRWARARGRQDARAAARRLYAAGLRGVDPELGVTVGALWPDFTVRERGARIWPQTEYLKAALIFGDEAEALGAAQAMALYLDTPRRGAWRDKLRADGGFVEEPAPATSLYHLLGAILPLRRRFGP